MKWISIRVSKYTRTLHPEDHQEGLPQPGLDEGAGRYRDMVVGCQGGVWVGRDDVSKAWLEENSNKEEYANDAKKEAPKKKRPIKKARKKPLPKQKVEEL